MYECVSLNRYTYYQYIMLSFSVYNQRVLCLLIIFVRLIYFVQRGEDVVDLYHHTHNNPYIFSIACTYILYGYVPI